MERDRLGRRRSPEQERGLRPLHPLLPEEWISKALRVAMSDADWAHFEALVSRYKTVASSQARAHGMAISALIRHIDGRTGEVSPELGNEDLTIDCLPLVNCSD